MANATLIISQKVILESGAIVQIRVWRLPERSDERPHGLKYSLYYGLFGERIIAYDNEIGKGCHRHYRNREEPYLFVTLEQLIADFERDVREEIGLERG